MRNLMTVLLVFSCTSLALAQQDYHKVEVFAGYSYNSVDKIAGSELTSPEIPSSLDRSLAKRKGLQGFNTSVTYNFSRYVGAKFDFSGYYGREGNEDFDGRTGTFIPSSTYTDPRWGTVTIPASVLPTRHTSYGFLGGVQIKDNSKDKRIKPFAHFLLGVARQSVEYKYPDDTSSHRTTASDSTRIAIGEKATTNGLSWALGGGLDIRVHRRISIRVIQFDYNPVRTKEQTLLAIGDIKDFSGTFMAPVGLPGPFGVPGKFNQSSAITSIGIQRRTQHNFRIGFGIVFH